MYLSKAVLDPRDAVLHHVYDSHQALWSLFADHPERKRDFLYRDLGEGAFLCLSERMPEDTKGIWSIRHKEFDPQLKAGDRLYFSLRANAVKKCRDEQDKQVRHDIVQHERMRLLRQGVAECDMPSRGQIAQEKGWEWFASRQEAMGLEAEPATFMVATMALHALRKKGVSRKARLAVYDFTGFATVTEPDRLRDALFNGIGPAKGFGCGLLLIRRA